MSTCIDPGQVSLSVCIATYHRPILLGRCLDSLAKQTFAPLEIVISNAGSDEETPRVIAEFTARYAPHKVLHCPTDRCALPWQRWWAFTHSKGEIVLFLDDDIELTPDALRSLIATYTRANFNLAGVGFLAVNKGIGLVTRRQGSIRERWLRIQNAPDGNVTAGGQAVSWSGAPDSTAWKEVQRLGGGGMSYPREILAKIGPLEHLYELYDQRFGKGEDGVLSTLAGRYGKLLLLVGPLTYHPDETEAPTTAFPRKGFRRGIVGTWGIAHTMRWMASDFRSYRSAWTRAALMELFRSTSSIVRRPFARISWYQLCGAITGFIRTVLHWRDIPLQPSRSRKSGSVFTTTNRLPGFCFLLPAPQLVDQFMRVCEGFI